MSLSVFFPRAGYALLAALAGAVNAAGPAPDPQSDTGSMPSRAAGPGPTSSLPADQERPGGLPPIMSSSLPPVQTAETSMAPAPAAPVPAAAAQKFPKKPARTQAPTLESFPGPDQQRPERVLYKREPVRVLLESQRERRITLPWEAYLMLPESAEGRIEAQIIGRTLYVTGLRPSAPEDPPVKIRAIAEGLEGQGMVPLDIEIRAPRDRRVARVADDLEIFLAPGNEDRKAGEAREEDAPPPAPDLVQLSRYCSQQLYAPERLIRPMAWVRRVDVRAAPVSRLYRGAMVVTTPIGAWRSPNLYVTAVRFTNRASHAVELDMAELRGTWIAATPQHYRLAAAGDEADTTAVCLISEQAFDAARP